MQRRPEGLWVQLEGGFEIPRDKVRTYPREMRIIELALQVAAIILPALGSLRWSRRVQESIV